MSTLFGELVWDNEIYRFVFENFYLKVQRYGTDTETFEAMIEAFLGSQKGDLPDTLMGTCYPDGHKIFFMQLSSAGVSNNVKIISVGSYFEIKPNLNFPLHISQITIVADELNLIYPPSQMYSYTSNDKGMITAMNFTSPRQSFEWKFDLSQKIVTVSSGFSHSYRWNTTPIQIQSMLHFGFEPTEDYKFVVRVFDIGQRLLQYLCYRQNINCTDAGIYMLTENGEHARIGSFSAKWMCDQDPETEKRILEKNIPFSLVGDTMSQLLQRLSDGTLYDRHIPDNSKDERRITPARSIMLTAAFEWEYKQIYLAGKKPTDSFMNRLIKSLNDYSDCIESFAQRVYSLNNKTYSVDAVAETIKDARNDFAHGDIKIYYDLETLLGFVILPYLIYSMQLRAAGMSTDSIKQSIKNLFVL